MNNKGFTLVELLTILVLLAIVSGIAVTSVSMVSETSKKSECKVLASNIETAGQMLYEECSYGDGNGTICNNSTDNITYDSTNKTVTTTIENLVTYGFLSVNINNDSSFNVTNPMNNSDIKDTSINIKYDTSSNKVVTTMTDKSIKEALGCN